MALTLGNPISSTSTAAVTSNQLAIKMAGQSLSTGIDANIDVVSYSMGKSLSDKHLILSKILNNMGYSKNAADVASTSLSSMAKTIADMLGTIAQATGNSDDNLSTRT